MSENPPSIISDLQVKFQVARNIESYNPQRQSYNMYANELIIMWVYLGLSYNIGNRLTKHNCLFSISNIVHKT